MYFLWITSQMHANTNTNHQHLQRWNGHIYIQLVLYCNGLELDRLEAWPDQWWQTAPLSAPFKANVGKSSRLGHFSAGFSRVESECLGN